MFNLILCSLFATFGLIGTTMSTDYSSVIVNTKQDDFIFIEGEDAIDYAKSFGIDNYSSIESVYITTNIFSDEKNVSAYYFGNDYYIDAKSIVTTYEKGALIRKSEYYAEGDATMTVSESYGATFSFGFEIGTDELRAKLGYSKSTTFTISDSYSIHLNQGEAKSISCYQNIEKKTFDVWEDDIWFDDFVGNYYSKKPIGCSFFVSNL